MIILLFPLISKISGRNWTNGIFSLILVGSSMGFLTYADYSECRAKNLVPVIAATPDLTNV